MSCIEDMIEKMRRRFNATDENVKDIGNDLSGIREKVDSHTISMTQFSTTMNPDQPSTHPSYTILNPNNYDHCVTVIIHKGM